MKKASTRKVDLDPNQSAVDEASSGTTSGIGKFMKFTFSGKRCALWIALLVTAFGAALYFLAVQQLTVNFPRGDEYHVFLDGLLDLNAANTGSERLDVLTSQHNEARPAFQRCVAFALYQVQKRVDFQSLTLVGNLGLLFLSLTLALGLRRSVNSPVLLSFLPLLLLTPIHQNNSTWAINSLTHHWAPAFALLALFLVTNRCGHLSFVGACITAVAATYTSGEGMVCFVPGLVALILQRRWKQAVGWFVLFIVVVALYFCGYQQSATPFPTEFSFRSVVFFPTMLGAPVSNLLLRLLNPFRDLLGVEGITIVLFRMTCGLVLVGIGIILWVKGYHKRNLFLSMVVVYMVMLCAIASVTRSSAGLGMALAGRYFVFTLPLIICLVIALLDCYAITESRGNSILISGLCIWMIIWCLYYPWMCVFSDKQSKLRLQFIQTQSPESIDCENPIAEKYRYHMVDTLWQSYLSGLLPLSDLYSSEGLHMPLKTLRAIAIEDRELHKATDMMTKLVARFQKDGDRLLLESRSSPATPENEGAIYLRQGRLYYSMPHE